MDSSQTLSPESMPPCMDVSVGLSFPKISVTMSSYTAHGSTTTFLHFLLVCDFSPGRLTLPFLSQLLFRHFRVASRNQTIRIVIHTSIFFAKVNIGLSVPPPWYKGVAVGGGGEPRFGFYNI